MSCFRTGCVLWWFFFSFFFLFQGRLGYCEFFFSLLKGLKKVSVVSALNVFVNVKILSISQNIKGGKKEKEFVEIFSWLKGC